MKFKVLIPVILFLTFNFQSVVAQLIIDNTIPVNDLVNNFLISPGLSVSNIIFTGNPVQLGYFNSTSANVGLNEGIILATHDVNEATGPNNSSSAGGSVSNPANGDPDIALVAGTAAVNDNAILEFDFVANGTTVQFNFVFASEEYPEYVNSINDAFGLFISGPGIAGPYSNGAENIAIVPGTTTPISINTVNTFLNSAYYIDNGDGFSAPYNASNTYIQYDGLTVPITATYNVECGKTYHLKFAIADVSDAVWGSAVFLEAGSFTSSNGLIINSSEQNALCEGVNDGSIALSAVGGLPPYQYSIDGGISFQSSFAFFNIGPGSYPVMVKDANDCSVQTPNNIVVQSTFTVNTNLISQDISCFGDLDGLIQMNASGGIPPYQYSIDNGNNYSPTGTFSNLSAANYAVKVLDDTGCVATSVEFINQPLELIVESTPDNCYDVGQQVFLVANARGGNSPYSFNWVGIGSHSAESVNASTDQNYTISVTDVSGCSVVSKTSVRIKPQVDFAVNDTDICERNEVVFTNNSVVQNASISCLWDFGDGHEIQNDCGSQVLHTYDNKGHYSISLSVIDGNNCVAQLKMDTLILVRQAAIADFFARPSSELTTINNIAQFKNTSIKAQEYLWSIDGKFLSDSLEPEEYTFPNENGDDYQVCLKAISLGGCSDSICRTIEVKEVLLAYIPNAFSPDGNNLNDKFSPILQGVSSKDYLFQIFDRWGDLIYTTNNINDGWEGDKNGKPVMQGVYNWTLQVKSIETKKQFYYRGFVNVMP